MTRLNFYSLQVLKDFTNQSSSPLLTTSQTKRQNNKFSSVSINIKYKIVIDFIIIDDVIILIDFDSHDEVY